MPSGKAKSKDITISGVVDGATVKYKLITGSTCNATAYTGGSGETTVTITSGSGTATVTAESDNSKYLCFKLTKTNYTTGYVGSAQITGIDDTAPTVTSGSTGYYEGFTVGTRAFGTAASGSYKAADDIYTKVTFSEDMKQTAGTGGTAKPVIKYSIAGTETQYEITAQGTGTLDSGKCRPNHATETDEYVCRYTVGASDTGAFKVVVDTGSTDIATNALASKYTHSASVTLDTTVPTVGTNTIATSNSNSSYAKQGDTITITIDFSEEIVEANTTIKYQIGTGTETDFTYTTSTITSGKCKETTDSTDIYTCKYTIASGDTGLFKAKVSAFKDMAGNAGTAQTYNTTGVTADTTAPTATYAITNTGGNSSNSKNYLNASDTVSVTATFSETVSTAPTVQFINDSTNLGSAVTGSSVSGEVTAAEGSVYYSPTLTGSDTGNSSDALDFGDPSATVAGLVRESVSGGGYVYKITRAMPKVVIRASVTFDLGSALVARWSATKPTSSQIATAGTQMWSSGSESSEGNFAIGTKVFTNVTAGTYFWIYPSAGANRTASNRNFLFVAGDAADVVAYSSGTIGGSDTGNTNDAIDFGALTSVSGVARESLGSAVMCTKPPNHSRHCASEPAVTLPAKRLLPRERTQASRQRWESTVSVRRCGVRAQTAATATLLTAPPHSRISRAALTSGSTRTPVKR